MLLPVFDVIQVKYRNVYVCSYAAFLLASPVRMQCFLSVLSTKRKKKNGKGVKG